MTIDVGNGRRTDARPSGINLDADADASAPDPTMHSALTFLAMTRRCEIAELEQLAQTCELVGITGRLVHGLQLERGLSSLFLGSNGARFAQRRLEQIDACRPLVADLQHWFDALDGPTANPGARARLYSRIAWAKQGLDALEALRRHITALNGSAQQANAAFCRLIAALLTVVFEAADDASDPEVSRLLVAIFHLMQAKEFAGQERAIGGALLATGISQADERKRLLRLIESQERCSRIISTFSGAAADHPCSAPAMSAGVDQERLRRILLTAEGRQPLPPNQEASWFDACTARMDAMKVCEEALVADLLALCRRKTEEARQELVRYETLARGVTDAARAGADSAQRPDAEFAGDPATASATASTSASAKASATATPQACATELQFFLAPIADASPNHDPLWADGEDWMQPLGHCLGRSVLDLVCEQSRRLQSMKEELDTVRSTLNERKVIERAKGLLMAHRKLNEEQAHRVLRQLAMNQSRRLIDIAEAVLTSSEVLSEPPARS